MKLTSIAVATAVGAALALGTVVPAQAAGEAVSINPVPTAVTSTTRDTTIPITVNVSPFGAGVDEAYLNITVTDGTNSLYTTAAATAVIAGPNLFSVTLPYYQSPGTYTVTATLETDDYDVNPYAYTVAAQTTVTIKAHATVDLTSGHGKPGHAYTVKGRVSNKAILKGSKAKLYLAKKGSKHYKKVASSKIKKNGHFVVKAKTAKIGAKYYVKVPGKGLIVTSYSSRYKIVKRFF